VTKVREVHLLRYRDERFCLLFPYTGLVQLTANDRAISILLPSLRQEFDWAAVESISNAAHSVVLWIEPSIGEHTPARHSPHRSSKQRLWTSHELVSQLLEASRALSNTRGLFGDLQTVA